MIKMAQGKFFMYIEGNGQRILGKDHIYMIPVWGPSMTPDSHPIFLDGEQWDRKPAFLVIGEHRYNIICTSSIQVPVCDHDWSKFAREVAYITIETSDVLEEKIVGGFVQDISGEYSVRTFRGDFDLKFDTFLEVPCQRRLDERMSTDNPSYTVPVQLKNEDFVLGLHFPSLFYWQSERFYGVYCLTQRREEGKFYGEVTLMTRPGIKIGHLLHIRDREEDLGLVHILEQ